MHRSEKKWWKNSKTVISRGSSFGDAPPTGLNTDCWTDLSDIRPNDNLVQVKRLKCIIRSNMDVFRWM